MGHFKNLVVLFLVIYFRPIKQIMGLIRIAENKNKGFQWVLFVGHVFNLLWDGCEIKQEKKKESSWFMNGVNWNVGIECLVRDTNLSRWFMVWVCWSWQDFWVSNNVFDFPLPPPTKNHIEDPYEFRWVLEWVVSKDVTDGLLLLIEIRGLYYWFCFSD